MWQRDLWGYLKKEQLGKKEQQVEMSWGLRQEKIMRSLHNSEEITVAKTVSYVKVAVGVYVNSELQKRVATTRIQNWHDWDLDQMGSSGDTEK